MNDSICEFRADTQRMCNRQRCRLCHLILITLRYFTLIEQLTIEIPGWALLPPLVFFQIFFEIPWNFVEKNSELICSECAKGEDVGSATLFRPLHATLPFSNNYPWKLHGEHFDPPRFFSNFLRNPL